MFTQIPHTLLFETEKKRVKAINVRFTVYSDHACNSILFVSPLFSVQMNTLFYNIYPARQNTSVRSWPVQFVRPGPSLTTHSLRAR